LQFPTITSGTSPAAKGNRAFATRTREFQLDLLRHGRRVRIVLASGAGESEVPLSPAERGAQQRRVRHQAGGSRYRRGSPSRTRELPTNAGDRERRRPDHARSLHGSESHSAVPKQLRDATLRSRMARLSTVERNSVVETSARDALFETTRHGNSPYTLAPLRTRKRASPDGGRGRPRRLGDHASARCPAGARSEPQANGVHQARARTRSSDSNRSTGSDSRVASRR
jgi:hypothetical protein